jgi:hypothetical protein
MDMTHNLRTPDPLQHSIKSTTRPTNTSTILETTQAQASLFSIQATFTAPPSFARHCITKTLTDYRTNHHGDHAQAITVITAQTITVITAQIITMITAQHTRSPRNIQMIVHQTTPHPILRACNRAIRQSRAGTRHEQHDNCLPARDSTRGTEPLYIADSRRGRGQEQQQLSRSSMGGVPGMELGLVSYGFQGVGMRHWCEKGRSKPGDTMAEG